MENEHLSQEMNICLILAAIIGFVSLIEASRLKQRSTADDKSCTIKISKKLYLNFGLRSNTLYNCEYPDTTWDCWVANKDYTGKGVPTIIAYCNGDDCWQLLTNKFNCFYLNKTSLKELHSEAATQNDLHCNRIFAIVESPQTNGTFLKNCDRYGRMDESKGTMCFIDKLKYAYPEASIHAKEEISSPRKSNHKTNYLRKLIEAILEKRMKTSDSDFGGLYVHDKRLHKSYNVHDFNIHRGI